MRSASSALPALVAAAGLFFLAKHASAECDPTLLPEDVISFASSSNRLYVDYGCVTIADLLAYRGLDNNGTQRGPVFHFDPVTNWYSANYTGVYYLESSIHIRYGGKLSIDGSESSVDECETLLMASNSSTYQNIRAHGGDLDIRFTSIFSWDLLAQDYDHDTSDGRSYLSAVTEKLTGRDEDKCLDDPRRNETGYSTGEAKNDMGDSRMDILRSEIAYLGHDAAESYGIAYKARGLCKDLTNLDIYDDDNGLDYGVKGDILRCHIHHNWFGHYSWGHDGGKWQYNEVHDNEIYGFDPHDDSDNVKIIGNVVYNNGVHGIIASKRCTDITIKKNVVYNNGDNGIMLHRSCDRAIVRENYSYGNGDAGLALYESSDCKVLRNVFEDNTYGVRWSNGANRNRVFENVMITTDREDAEFGIYMFRGNDDAEAEGNLNGHPTNNSVYSNEIFTAKEEAWKMNYADSNLFRVNTFHNGSFATFEHSVDNKVNNNVYPEGFAINFDDDSCFRSGTEPKC